VLQGERAEARYNRTLGRFHLEGILPAPRGVPKIKVTFDIDANGILSVTAKDEATGKDQRITITAGSGLSDADIRKMVEDAKSHEAEDQKRRQQIEARNKADQLCYQVEKALDGVKDKLGADKVADIESKVRTLRGAVEREDHEAIHAGTDALEKAMADVAQAAYGAAAAAAGSPPSEAPEAKRKGKDGDVIDAEFEEN